MYPFPSELINVLKKCNSEELLLKEIQEYFYS